MSLNRIYQGRVAAVETGTALAKGNVEWMPAAGGDEVLWQHHELFQAAINYYLVALLALADKNNPVLGPLISQMDNPQSPYHVWGSFRRQGRQRTGLSQAVAPYITPGNNAPTLDEVFRSILAGNPTDRATLDAALMQLLKACDGAGAIQQEGRSYWPKFCDPDSTANFAGDPAMLRREQHRLLLPQVLHDPAITHDSPALGSFDTYSIATPDTRTPQLTGPKARARLEQAITLWRVRLPESAADFDRLASSLKKIPDDDSRLNLQGYVGSSAKGEVQARLFALLLFRHLERSSFTLGLLRSATPPPKNAETPPPAGVPLPAASAADPVRIARGKRSFVFRAFTSLPCWHGGDNIHPTWKSFDIAAFKYALTVINQIEEKTKERQKECAELETDFDYMHGRLAKIPVKYTTGEAEPPPILANDLRIPLLRELLQNIKVDTALTDGEAVSYGLQRRTIRGFRELRRIWRGHAPAGTVFSSELKEKLAGELRQFQTDNSTTIGSVQLFNELIQNPKYWPIWQAPDVETARQWADAGFADDPLAALVQEAELQEDIDALKAPVKLTPADPEYSRRQYDFNAVSKFGAGSRSANRHEPGQTERGHNTFTTEIAARNAADGNRWRATHVRIHYSAPRLLRDGLRRPDTDGNEALEAVPWLQPMMEALAPLPTLPQDLTGMPVFLMPDVTLSGERRILLNLPVTLEPAALVEQLGNAGRWQNQFFGSREDPFALRWPADGAVKTAKGKTHIPWHQDRDHFTVLGVDLGTRDAGALALLNVTAQKPAKPVHRIIGEADGRTWYASLADARMIRLPGEDARLFVRGKLVQEPYGERGRNASLLEWEDARNIILRLGQNPDELLGADPRRHSYPEINDKLLVALRRAQARLARLQNRSWRLRDLAESDKALDEIHAERAGEKPSPLPPLARDDAIKSTDEALLSQRDIIRRSFVQIANLILPLRGRRWEWRPHVEVPDCHILAQSDPGTDDTKRLVAGQRGISHERIEQIEELRRRCQSLNRALRHKPGERPVLGRPAKGEEIADPCPALLEKINRLRDQRVDQTAHAILAAALGVRLRAPSKDRAERRHRDIHGEYERFRAPADFVVIENLSRYLSSQDRARSENTRLMQWCHRQIVQKLRQLCETYGIPVLAVPAAYSSRFSSRDGSAGFRAVHLTPDHRHRMPWSRILARLKAHEEDGKRLEKTVLDEARAVRGLFDRLDRFNAGHVPGKPWRTLLAPLPGGPVFVPLGDATPMQADLNAAINIALRGIAAPDRHDIHHRLRAENKKRILSLRLGTQREKARWPGGAPAVTLSTPNNGASPEDSDALPERVSNLFVDIAGVANFERVTIEGVSQKFATGRGLWASVKQRAWNRVARLNETVTDNNRNEEEDDIPM
ncbi:hypothetical protein OPIT5_03625 [Opitutaceae bacterium TAV5]|nr:hypothetical protein OPIT5_03625 [Opitutaceae bacterium TAV5]